MTLLDALELLEVNWLDDVDQDMVDAKYYNVVPDSEGFWQRFQLTAEGAAKLDELRTPICGGCGCADTDYGGLCKSCYDQRNEDWQL